MQSHWGQGIFRDPLFAVTIRKVDTANDSGIGFAAYREGSLQQSILIQQSMSLNEGCS